MVPLPPPGLLAGRTLAEFWAALGEESPGPSPPRSKVVDVLKELFTSDTVVLDQLSNFMAGIYSAFLETPPFPRIEASRPLCLADV